MAANPYVAMSKGSQPNLGATAGPIVAAFTTIPESSSLELILIGTVGVLAGRRTAVSKLN